MKLLITLILLCCNVALAVGPCPAAPVPASVSMSLAYDRSVKMFPSLTPRIELKISTINLVNVVGDENRFIAQSGIPAAYLVMRQNPATGDYNQPVKVEAIDNDLLFSHPPGANNEQHLVYLQLAPGELHTGDHIKVCLLTAPAEGRPQTNYESEDLSVTVPVGYTINVTPSYVAKQELNNGQKRDVGHFDLNFDVPYVPASPRFAAWYWTGKSTLSTDGKDKSSAVSVATGLRRNLLRTTYLPAFLEAKGYGNQTADNASAMVQAGFNALFPSWKKVANWGDWLSNSVLDAPVPPELTFAVQNEWRIEQDPDTKKKFPGERSFRLFAQTNWAPILLLPPPKDSRTIDPGALSIEFLGKAWYMPHEQRLDGAFVQRLEGDVEISLLIAVSKLSFTRQKDDSISLTSGDAPKQRIRLKYMRGANEANGFTHVHQLSIGIESSK